MLVEQGTVTLTRPMIPDLMNKVLSIVRIVFVVVLELLHVLFVFGLLVELLPGLSVPSEDHILQAPEKMALTELWILNTR